ncbi:hypothetical protein HS961_11145 [Comamonas piscis]|uniref:Uncharacterized protein n=1 Tax=Comamonas piscis TaxID=1562974 RepID=A0A7G5EH65_9BURK|nr:hypothetical protein [Comamonas piscis]QMV73340.1 hypothetical protein HS961_11145 [Comamonas piscis]WSO36142.1 hypothetical protein VUJ63_11180 [Comamonas piscis]
MKEGRHYVSYITGPSHVLLGIKFTSAPTEPLIIKTANTSGCSHGHLDEARIKAAVTNGLSSFREEFGIDLHAEEIVYVENDSPRYNLFTGVAYLLAKHLSDGGDFDSIS